MIGMVQQLEQLQEFVGTTYYGDGSQLTGISVDPSTDQKGRELFKIQAGFLKSFKITQLLTNKIK